MFQQFLNKVVIIIGGNSGIGLASAVAFSKEGARVLIVGRDSERVRHATEQVGHGAIGRCCDISEHQQIVSLFNYISERLNRIDVLFVNAGVLTVLPIESVTEADWDLVHDTNLKGVFFTVQAALPFMSTGSVVVLTGSVAGHEGVPMASVYAASKAGLSSLGRSFAAELVAKGIRVNVVSPGPTETPIYDRAVGLGANDVGAMKDKERDSVPMKRMGTPEEVAAAVLFLASDAASFITGIDLLVAGGS